MGPFLSAAFWDGLGGWLPAMLLLFAAATAALVATVWHLTRQTRSRQLAEHMLREDLSRISAEFARQIELLQSNLASKVAESNRDQREINALFISQLQQASQGSGQLLERVRQTVADNLNKVAGSLQEMQAVTGEVRQLKQILGNVRTRGIIGELQLERLLADILVPGQFERQVRIRPEKQEAVDFTIRMPGDKNGSEPLLLPVDAKFPMDYLHRLLAAQDNEDFEAAAVFRQELGNRIRQEAKKIAELYIMPPRTVDFAVLYLPTESLFAEVVREPDLTADLYRQHRVILAGPSSMSAMLAGLMAAFRLQSLEQKSFMIAEYLQELQRDFHLFCESLERSRSRIARAMNEMEDSAKRAAQVRRRLDSLDRADWQLTMTGQEEDSEHA
jgi:DNA recombination protein RmuC